MANKRSSNYIDLTQSSDAENNPPPSKKQARAVVRSQYPTPSPSHASQQHSSQTSQTYGSQPHSSHFAPGPQVHGSQRQPRQPLGPRDAWSNDSQATQATQHDDENEIIDLSQDVDDHGWICLGAIDGKIVGVRYYNGYATVNEQVMVKREPGNPYDSNAIRINNVHGNQVGHLPKTLAVKLAPYMDSRAVVIEGIISGEKGFYDCPIQLKLFGPGEPIARAELEARMKADKLPLKTRALSAPKKPKQSVPPPRRPLGYVSSQASSSQQLPEQSIADLTAGAERFRPRDVQEIIERWGAGEDALANMPMADQPEHLQATLLPYQRQGLAWMLEKENPVYPAIGSNDICQLWRRDPNRPNAFLNVASGYSTADAPRLARGGILADDMGLGKTLQLISVILEGGPGTTLILAPLSVMSNWAQQIERHIKNEHALKVLTYHGPAKHSKKWTHQEFSEFDVVISTYGTVGTEYSASTEKLPRKSGLFSMNWARLILDEGHQIRNAATRAAMSATALLAKSRWVLTGTPIVNSIKDLHSMLKFLAISGGLETKELFNSILARPLAAGDPTADLLLQSIMRTFCLRRKKDMKFIDLKLPELSEYVHRIAFRQDEKQKYDVLVSEAKGMVQRYADGKAGKGLAGYSQVLEVLLRLRQVCCHWKLTGTRITDLLALIEKDDIVIVNKETKIALQLLLQLSIDSRDECSICLDDLHNPVITACKHVFGRECIERTIEYQHKCPMCRAHLENKEVLIEPAEEEDAEQDPDIDVDTKSSKTEALMSILAASRRDPLSKVVIFSQWTSFLNIIQNQLDEAGYEYARIDGTMKPSVRDEGMAALESDPSCRILLASLSVCSVGLNLVAADTVILADSWWAPAIEDQAVDRVHRLGQTRPCTVWRLVMEGSVEERVLEIQADKRKLVGKAFQEKTKRGKGKSSSLGDIIKLLA